MKRPSTKGIKDIMCLLYGRRCFVCRKRFDKLQYHHMIPFSQGGETTIANGALLCKQCHWELENTDKKSEYKHKIIAYKEEIEYKNSIKFA